jgi:hypothetical protein
MDDPLTDMQIAALAAHARSEAAIAGGIELAEHSRGLRLIGRDHRETLAHCFLEAVADFPDANHADPYDVREIRRDYRQRAKLSGIPVGIIFLFLGIAWDIFWRWWTRRNTEVF